MTLISIIIILSLYLGICYALYRFFVRIKSPIAVTIISIFYLLGTYYYFELINTIEHKLATRMIYLEYGHANIILLELLLVCMILAIVNIILIFIKRHKIKIASH